MADSRRQKIVDALVTRMKLIDGTGSYQTDVEDRVKDSETAWAEDQDTLPAISVFDGDAEATATSKGRSLQTIHVMSVMIRGYCKQGTTAANARKLLADIKRAIRVDDKLIVSGTPLIMQSEEKKDGIVRTEDTFEVEGCEVEFLVQFQTDKFNAE